MVEHLPSMGKALSSIPSTKRKKRAGNKNLKCGLFKIIFSVCCKPRGLSTFVHFAEVFKPLSFPEYKIE
jgi:hypothetical protein